MTPSQALRAVQGYAVANKVRYRVHALNEAADANATQNDMRHALVNAHSCVVNDSEHWPGSWKVKGPDLDGDELTLIVKIMDGLLVITVW